MLESITKAKYIKDYKVWIAFNDGKNGEIDLAQKLKKELKGEVFEPLQDVNYFKKFKVKNGTLSWRNEADIAPESLYDLLHKQNKLTKKIATKSPTTKKTMPEISRFLGIIISMYYNEHNPPHFHARYGKYEISVEIESGVISGKFPSRALKLVLDWHDLNKQELLKDWELARKGKIPKKIKPLE